MKADTQKEEEEKPDVEQIAEEAWSDIAHAIENRKSQSIQAEECEYAVKRIKEAILAARPAQNSVAAQNESTVQGLEATLWVIEQIVSDDFCEDLEMRTIETTPEHLKLTGDLKTCEEKMGKIYMIAHSAIRAHSCYRAHDSWRKLRDELLAQGEPLIASDTTTSTDTQQSESGATAVPPVSVEEEKKA